MRSLYLALLVVLTLAACGQPAKHGPTVPPPTGASDPTCPLEIPGTSITVEDTTDGAALVFVTTGDAAAVQARADAFVAARGKPGDTSFASMVAHDAKVTSQHIDQGVKLLFTGDAAAIQSELRMHAGHLSAGSCAMAM